jgi:hypothetical protein
MKTIPQPSDTNAQAERIAMSLETDGPRSLREMELEVEGDGREWMRSKKLVTTAMGMNSGSQLDDGGAKLRR